MKVTFADDYRFERIEFTANDFQELIPRPKEDPSNSPNLESKADSKKKSGVKRSNSMSKGSSNSVIDIPEKVVTEFGISSKAMRKLGVSRPAGSKEAVIS